MQKERRLGKKVFYYYISKKILFGIVLLIVSIIFTYIKDPVLAKILFFLSTHTAEGVISILISIMFLTSFAFLLGGLLLAWVNYVSCTFNLGELAFSIRRGILNKKELSIPYRQIQNVNIEQSFSHRMMGVCKLIVQTAGNDNNDKEGEAEGVFDIVDRDVAEEIQKVLLYKISGKSDAEIVRGQATPETKSETPPTENTQNLNSNNQEDTEAQNSFHI